MTTNLDSAADYIYVCVMFCVAQSGV